MRRKSSIALLVIGIFLVLSASNAFADIPDRIRDQQKRIDKGIASGELTRAEANTLQDNLNWIKQRYSRLKANGRLTPWERAGLEGMLDENGEMIYNKKHNTITPVYQSNFQARIDDQQRQIDGGIASGKLSRREADLVQDNLNWIKATFARLKADGRLNRGEFDKLDRMLDQNGLMIVSKKRNPVKRLY